MPAPRQGGKCHRRLTTGQLLAGSELSWCGLGKIDCYAGGTLADFDERNSDTLMVLAQPGSA